MGAAAYSYSETIGAARYAWENQLLRIFQPDAVMPSQYWEGPELTPEQRLMLALFERCVRDLACEKGSVERAHAAEWFEWPGRGYISLEMVCARFGCDVGCVQAGARRLLRDSRACRQFRLRSSGVWQTGRRITAGSV